MNFGWVNVGLFLILKRKKERKDNIWWMMLVSGKLCMYGAGSIWEISIPPPQFYGKHIIAVKNKVLKINAVCIDELKSLFCTIFLCLFLCFYHIFFPNHYTFIVGVKSAYVDPQTFLRLFWLHKVPWMTTWILVSDCQFQQKGQREHLFPVNFKVLSSSWRNLEMTLGD